MTERTGALFRELPILFVRPKRRKFGAGKTCAHADPGIVACNVVASNHPKQPAAKQRPAATMRLNGDETFRAARNHVEQSSESCAIKVMQKQISDDHIAFD